MVQFLVFLSHTHRCIDGVTFGARVAAKNLKFAPLVIYWVAR